MRIIKGSKYSVIFTHPYRGVPIQWRNWVFNGGKPFYSYRFGPIIVTVRDV